MELWEYFAHLRLLEHLALSPQTGTALPAPGGAERLVPRL
jgi:hypothetical protein